MDLNMLRTIGEHLRERVFGNEEFIQALLAAYYKRLVGVPTHLLGYGPPGIGKTWTSKNFARIASELNGGRIVYARIQGRPDLMPEEIIADRVVQYDDAGKPGFGYQLGSIEMLRAEKNLLPAILHVDELDKITARSMYALLEIMEEQQATLASGQTIPLNFVMVATANTRKYDAVANPIPKPVQDRFRAGVVHLGYGTAEHDRQILNWHVNSWAMSVNVAAELLQGLVTVVKMTQQKVGGYSDFTRYIKVPAGPRAILDLYSEAATRCIFDSRNFITPQDVIEVGVRILRGRVEVTPDAEINGKTTDVVITEILYEVFGEMKVSSGSGGGSGEPSQQAEAQAEAEAGGSEESADDESAEKKDGQSQDGSESASAEATADKSETGDDQKKQGPNKDSSSTSEADRQSFMAGLRKEMSQEESGSQDPQ
ncbi:MAG: hypothetical protein AUJ71_02375 [Candidatus Omnitrophica bacterium CG1_02_49_16]|nr:MAG: hypothetical protein AUJ71_02375 [Candidatus Omnitrophica bacterium CG1_02_49_16]